MRIQNRRCRGERRLQRCQPGPSRLSVTSMPVRSASQCTQSGYRSRAARMNARIGGSAAPIDGASSPAEAADAAPAMVRPRIRQDPPARATARAVARPTTPSPTTRTSARSRSREALGWGVALSGTTRENRSETLADGAAYDRSVTVVLSTLGRLAACSAQFS